jgi:hypothetical protein
MLLSARDTAISTQTSRFYAGPLPVYNGLDGLTVGSLHYRHDGDTMTFKGENLSLVSSVQIVDMAGQPIPGMNPLGRSSIKVLSETRFSISPNAFLNTHSSDSVTMDRRVRINTPFGSTTSTAADRFSFSATPVFERFGGPGFDTAANVYNAADGALYIYGKNFQGLKNLKFEDNASGIFLDIDLNPKSPPTGILINPAGTQIAIDPKFFAGREETWMRSGDDSIRKIRMTSPAKFSGLTSGIKTRDLLRRKMIGGTMPPIITLHPVGQNVTVGQNITLTVAATGATSYQWRKDSVNIPGATGTTYAINNFQGTDVGAYNVLVSNPGGAITSSSANLTIPLSLVIFTQPSSQSLALGADGNFTVVAGGTEPITYQWKKDGVNINGATAGTLLITNAQAADQGPTVWLYPTRRPRYRVTQPT